MVRPSGEIDGEWLPPEEVVRTLLSAPSGVTVAMWVVVPLVTV
jgi:hypothetical protein